MINIFHLLGTILAMFLSFALFSGFIFGAVHVIFTMVLLWWGRDVEGTLQSIRRRKTEFRNQHSRRAGMEYQLTVSYAYGDGRRVKVFTSKNWNAFHEVEMGRIIPIRVWTRVPGWAALAVDLPSWRDWTGLVIVGVMLSLVYGWVMQKLFFILLGFLQAEGVTEQVSRTCIVGACILIIPVYVAITFMELTKTQYTNPHTTGGTTAARRQRSVLVSEVRRMLSSVMRKLESEQYVHHPTNTEMVAMIPQGRDFV